MSSSDHRDAMREMGELTDPVKEMLRRMIAEFGDEHYHTCPADTDTGPCDCFAGALVANARDALEKAVETASKEGFNATQREIEIIQANAETRRLRQGIQDYLEGDYGRDQHFHTKHDTCPHGQFGWVACEPCIDAHFTTLLSSNKRATE